MNPQDPQNTLSTSPPPLHEEPTLPEILEEQRLAMRVSSSMSLDRMLLRDPDRVVHLVERRMKALETVRLGAIRQTDPIDWTINQDKEGRRIATLRKSGCNKVRKYFGISTINIRPQEVKITQNPDGTTTGEIWGDAFCALTGEIIQNLRGARTSGEQFTGRTRNETKASESVELSDLRESVRTNLESKAVRIMVGMSAVSVEELQAAWKDTGKDDAKCYHGHGYGTSAERDAGVNLDLLRKIFQAITAATKKPEAELLKEATSYQKNDKTYWTRTITDLKYDWQIQRAVERMKKQYPELTANILSLTIPDAEEFAL